MFPWLIEKGPVETRQFANRPGTIRIGADPTCHEHFFHD